MKLGVFMLWTEMRVAPVAAAEALPALAALPATLPWGAPPSALPRRGDASRAVLVSRPRPVKAPRSKKPHVIVDEITAS